LLLASCSKLQALSFYTSTRLKSLAGENFPYGTEFTIVTSTTALDLAKFSLLGEDAQLYKLSLADSDTSLVLTVKTPGLVLSVR
jgi:hypothetical protein